MHVKIKEHFIKIIISFRPSCRASNKQVIEQLISKQVHLAQFHHKLDGQGRARREAARRRKSECKVNLDILNSSRSKRLQKLYPRTTWRMDLRQLTAYEHFGCVNICAHTFFVCGPKFTTSPRKLW